MFDLLRSVGFEEKLRENICNNKYNNNTTITIKNKCYYIFLLFYCYIIIEFIILLNDLI